MINMCFESHVMIISDPILAMRLCLARCWKVARLHDQDYKYDNDDQGPSGQ